MATKFPPATFCKVYVDQPDPTQPCFGYWTINRTPSRSPNADVWFDDFLSGNTASPPWNLNSGGAGAGYAPSGQLVNSASRAIGVGALSTGTTATGYASLRTAATSLMFGTCGQVEIEGRIALQNLSTLAEEFSFTFGFHNNVANATDIDAIVGAYFRYHRLVDGDFWAVMTCNNSAIVAGLATTNFTKVVTASVPSVNATLLSVAVAPDGSEVRFRINGNQVARLTSNIPTTLATGVGTRIFKSLGLTSRAAYFDWTRLTYARGDDR